MAKGFEIERRYLLSGIPYFPEPVMPKHITQAYFETLMATDPMRVRLYRRLGKAYVTFKTGVGLVRSETPEAPPYEIDPNLAEEMIKIAPYLIDSKVRFPYQGWEIDVFPAPLAGIYLAEKELSSPDENVDIPYWLSPFVIREVTNSLSNLHLARLAADLRGTNVLALPHLENLLTNVPMIVITGPPCSGKSTVMKKLEKLYPDFHFVPEVATIVISLVGIKPDGTELGLIRFQKMVYQTQKSFEYTSAQFAQTQGKRGILLDRGKADQPAYMPGGRKQFEKVHNTSMSAEYANYHAVLFLDLPSRKDYEANSNNNSARMENYDQAVPLAVKLYDAWSGHPNLVRIPSTNTWEEKEAIVVECLESILTNLNKK